MKVIIAWDGDHIGREVGRASLADDVDGLRRISQAIDLGNRIWQSWVTMNNGSIISFGGDEGRAEIPAEKLADLPRIRNQYASAVGSSVSVGVGAKLSEADRALMAGKLQGGDKIVLWTPEVDQLIAKLQDQDGPRSEADKLSDEYLKKADQPGVKMPGKADAPSSGAPEGSPTQAIQGAVDDGPPPPEATASGDDSLSQFHAAAQAQDAQDKGQPSTQGQDQLKTQIVQVLQQLKQQMPILEQVKATNPDTYQSVMGLAQAVIMMARQMNGGDPNQEGPREKGDRAASQSQVEVPLSPDEQEKSKDDKKEESSSSDTKKSLAKAWPRDAAENQANTANHQVLQDMAQEGRPIAGRDQQMHSRVEAQAVRPDEAPRSVPIVPDPGYRRVGPAVNPKSGKVTVGNINQPNGGTAAAQQRARGAMSANGKVIDDMGMDSEQSRHGYQGPDVGSGQFTGSNGLDDEMADVAAASRGHIPQYDHRQNRFGLDEDPVHFRHVHVPEGSSIVSTYGPKRDPGDYVTAHTGVDMGPGNEGPMIGTYRVGADGQAMPVELNRPGTTNREQWSSHGSTHQDRGVLDHINQHLTTPQYEPSPPSANKGDNRAAMEARARALGLIKVEADDGDRQAIGQARVQDMSNAAIKAEKKPEAKDWHDCEEHGHCWGDGETAEHCLLCGATADDMQKDTLEANTVPPQRHHLQLPVGTHKDPGANAARQDAGAVKIQHVDNGIPTHQGWVQARAGQVMSPDGHAISARNPQGK